MSKAQELIDSIESNKDQKLLGITQNQFGEQFVVFTDTKHPRKHLVSGSELDWEVAIYENNRLWFSDVERQNIDQVIQDNK